MDSEANKSDQEMLTPQGVADYLNISVQTVYRYLNGDGVSIPMPSYKFSKKNIRVKKVELDLWVAKNIGGK
jgi:excisionase family DNA binding protein